MSAKAEFEWVKVRISLGARGRKVAGRQLSWRNPTQGDCLAGHRELRGDSNGKGTQRPRVVVRTLS